MPEKLHEQMDLFEEVTYYSIRLKFRIPNALMPITVSRMMNANTEPEICGNQNLKKMTEASASEQIVRIPEANTSKAPPHCSCGIRTNKAYLADVLYPVILLL